MHPLEPIMQELAIPVWAVGSASAMPELQAIYADRLQRNIYPAFAAPATTMRWDPRAYLPEAKSTIVIAVPYNVEPPPSIQASNRIQGQLARYAWGEDYHRVLHGKLELLGKRLATAFKATVWRAAVDSAPLSDRQLAVKNGMAAFGWNSCVFSRDYGSWIVLGSLLIDIELPHTETTSISMQCGPQCGACLKACPTGALEAPYTLNPYICLAYLTQASGVFPRDYRHLLGETIWGCDICQTVCPMNEQRQSLPAPYFGIPRYASLDLAEVLAWTKTEFDDKLGRSAAGWRGKTVLQRNAALALGNSKQAAAVQIVLNVLQNHGSGVVRASALWALMQLDPSLGYSWSQRCLAKDSDPTVQDEAEYWRQKMSKPNDFESHQP